MVHDGFDDAGAVDTDTSPSETPASSGRGERDKPQRITDPRLIVVETALGAEALRLKRMSGEEALSRLFRFELELVAEDPSVDFKQVVGRGVTVRIKLADATPRYFNGIISRIAQMAAEGGSATFKAELVPWTWLLTRTSNCRIFQNLTVPAIVEKLFTDHGFKDFNNRLQQQYPVRDYVVQYRETDFNFVSRLLEDSGIWYFFEHDNGRHVLVLCDTSSEHQPVPSQAKAKLTRTVMENDRQLDVITAFSVGHELRPSRYALGAFNFETPNTNLGVNVESVYASPTGAKPEIYDFPGGYSKRPDGETLVRLRIEEEEAQALQIRGASTCRAFRTGYRFELTEHPRKELNQSYAITSITHQVYEPQFGSKSDEEEPAYVNRFTCLPLNLPFRARRVTARPVIHGVQTAIVVGKKGEDLWVDKHGRVKVQFHWDREGKRDENSSCWVRVAQQWAGKRFGAMFLPRVGQEVLVEFVEGDPDQPIITGRVYNGEQTPPYDLPAEQTKSTIKSSNPKGGGFNELRFDDKKDAEQVFLHGQRDLDLVIRRDAREWMGGELHLIVEKSRLEQVNDEAHLKVVGNRVEEVGKDLVLRAGRLVIESAGSITLKSAGGFVQIDGGGVTVQGTQVNINSGGSPIASTAALRAPVKASSAGETGAAEPGAGEETTDDPPFDLVVAYYEEQLAKHGDKMTPEERARAQGLLEKLRDAAKRKDAAALQSTAQELHTSLEKAAGHPIDPPPGFVSAGTDANGNTILARKASDTAETGSETSIPGAGRRPPVGVVRVADRGLVDDAGPFYALGFTDFQAVRNFQTDRAFFDARLTQMAGYGYQYGRCLGSVSWAGLEIDPRAPGYFDAVKGVTTAYFQKGMRVQWTVGADLGTPLFKNLDVDAFYRDFAQQIAPLKHMLMPLEVVNESFNVFTGGSNWPHGMERLRACGNTLRSGAGVPVLLSAIPPIKKEGDEERFLAEYTLGGFVGCVHLERNIGTAEGRYRPPRQGRGPELSGKPWVDNEPIGPGSSGTSEEDPAFLLAGRIAAIMTGAVATVFHSRAGIGLAKGGAPFKQRLPDDGARACALVRKYLPDDIHRWKFANHTDANHPVRLEDGVMITDKAKSMSSRGAVRAFSRLKSGRGGDFILHVMGVTAGSSATANWPATMRIVEPLSGQERTVPPGQSTELKPSVNYIIFGTTA